MNPVNNNNCEVFYKGEHYINIIKRHSVSENEYTVTLFIEHGQSACIKFVMRNLENDLDSYSSQITPAVFEDMKIKQNLLLNYSDLNEQMKLLLEQNLCYENRVILRLYEVENSLELGFFTKSDLKELVLLIIPFQVTSTDDIITYLKEKVEQESIQKQVFQEKTEILNSELQNLHLKYRHLFSNFNTACEKMAEFEHQNNVLVEEQNHLKRYLVQLEGDNKTFLKNLESSKMTINQLEKFVMELKTDINCLQVGVSYYSNSNKVLKDALREQETKYVPKEKYFELRNMFSTAVLDLAKCQVSLSKLSTLHAGQRDENVQLQNEIRSLTILISNLEEIMKSEPVSSEVSEIRSLIERLELRASKPEDLEPKKPDERKPDSN